MEPMRISKSVYIVLQDGESHSVEEYEKHEEGWSSHSELYTRDGNTITLEIDNDGVDCDGRLSRSQDLYWPIGGPVNERGYPVWEETRSSQRDYSAEAAGY